MNRSHAVFHGRARCAFGRCHEAVVGRDRPTDNALLRCGAERDANAKMTPAGSPGIVNPPSSTYRAGNLFADMRNRWRRSRRSEEHTSELQSLMRISYAVFCLKKKKNKQSQHKNSNTNRPT